MITRKTTRTGRSNLRVPHDRSARSNEDQKRGSNRGKQSRFFFCVASLSSRTRDAQRHPGEACAYLPTAKPSYAPPRRGQRHHCTLQHHRGITQQQHQNNNPPHPYRENPSTRETLALRFTDVTNVYSHPQPEQTTTPPKKTKTPPFISTHRPVRSHG